MTETSEETPQPRDRAARYRQRLTRLSDRREQLRRSDKLLSRSRVILFLLAVLLLGIGYFIAEQGALLWIVPGWLLFIAFLAAAARQERVTEQIAEVGAVERVNRRAINRLQRNWDSLPMGDPPPGVSLTAVAEDLDLFGSASLFSLVSMAALPAGKRVLAQWMLEPALPADADERFDVARRWAGCVEERERFYYLSHRISAASAPPEDFIQWAAGRPLSERSPAILGLIRWLPLLWLPLILVWLVGLIATGWFGAGVFALLTLNVLITMLVGGYVHREFSMAAGGGRTASQYLLLFELLGDLPAESPLAERLCSTAREQARPAIERLISVLRLGLIRHNPMLFLPVYVPLQLIGLWDFQLQPYLERWQSKEGDSAAKWFETLGQAEALLSLAMLQYDYPDWAKPNWVPVGTGAVWQGTAVGHPLLPDDQRVCNDVSLGPAGRVLLVTGSNMSGKSTLLRSVGLNTVLAGMGAPTCTAGLTLPPLKLATSIRVKDSVRDGISFFMAELIRLKEVVQMAEHPAAPFQVMYLLDEVLQGTNSGERKIAVSRVLKSLTATGAIGALSTHDLELAADQEISAIADLVHFREHFEVDEKGTERMAFDYQMHHGVTPTTNALKLLEMMGIVSERGTG